MSFFILFWSGVYFHLIDDKKISVSGVVYVVRSLDKSQESDVSFSHADGDRRLMIKKEHMSSVKIPGSH